MSALIQGKVCLGLEVLNIYKFNIYQVLTFIFTIKANTTPPICQTQPTEIKHQYSTGFSKNSYLVNQLVYSHTNSLFHLEGWDPGTTC